MPKKLKSSTTTNAKVRGAITKEIGQIATRRLPRHRPPTHPGEMLREEFLVPLGVTQSELAERLGVSFPRLNEVIRGKRGVTPDTALRLARVVGMSPDFWLGLQQDWDLWHAMHGKHTAEINRLKPLGQIG
jgi:antitoxin HigA-1